MANTGNFNQGGTSNPGRFDSGSTGRTGTTGTSVTEKAKDAASGVAEKAKDMASSAVETVKSSVSDLSDKAGDIALHRDSHFDRTNSRIRTRNRIIEEDHESVPGEALERSFESKDELSQRLVILTQYGHRLLGLPRLGKCGEAPQVAEHDRDLASVTLEEGLVARRDHQLRELR